MALVASIASALAVLHGFAPAGMGPAGGSVLTGVFPGTLRAGYVYLPPGFDGQHRYPVVYLLHGMPGSPSEYLTGTAFLDFADTQIADGDLRPFIAVLPAAGPRDRYDGEWAGRRETALVDRVVPWVDGHLPTIATPAGRVLAGLSAGGFGAIDIALRHPSVFGAAESWSGYFTPLHDGPFKHATAAELAGHDPVLLAPAERAELRRDGLRFFVSTGPSHSHWFKASATVGFARLLERLHLPVRLAVFASRAGEWTAQLDAGLRWALAPGR